MRFSRSIAIVTMLLCIRLSAVAQPRLRTPEIYLGIHGGALGSMCLWNPRVSGTEEIHNTVLLGANGGLVFRYSGHKCCGLQLELNYMQKGWRENAETSAYTVHYTRRLDYIELPFLSHIYFGSPSFRGFFNLGPQIGYCIHDDMGSGTQNTLAKDHPQYEPIDNPFDWGIAGGLGCYYRHPKAGIFQLEARFNFSLGDTFSHSKTAYFSQSHAMNLSVNLAYLIPIPECKPKNQQ